MQKLQHIMLLLGLLLRVLIKPLLLHHAALLLPDFLVPFFHKLLLLLLLLLLACYCCLLLLLLLCVDVHDVTHTLPALPRTLSKKVCLLDTEPLRSGCNSGSLLRFKTISRLFCLGSQLHISI